MKSHFDILIVGAGPAGTGAAIELCKQKKMSFALIDRDVFPRDKICGDAIPGPAYKEMIKIFDDPLILSKVPENRKVISTRVCNESREVMDIHWVLEAYNIPRLSFDDYLFQEAKKRGTSIFEGHTIRTVEKTDQGYTVTTDQQLTFTCKILLAADGTNSAIRKQLAPYFEKDEKTIGLRAYYSGVDLAKTANHIYYRKDLLGYFWAFPLGGERWNIGYGVPDDVSYQGRGLKNEFSYFISEIPELSKAFEHAKLEGRIVGHKLAAYSKKRNLSGDGFMLCGDAAFLVDPVWGHGIDKAMISGKIAANRALEALKKKDTSAKQLQQYDRIIHKKMGKALRKQYLSRKIFANQNWIIEAIAPLLKLLDKRVK